MNKKKKKIPWWARRRFSCPDCGYIPKEDEYLRRPRHSGFDCPQCKSHFADYDFLELNYDKYNYKFDDSQEQNTLKHDK